MCFAIEIEAGSRIFASTKHNTMKKTLVIIALCSPLALFTQCGHKEVMAKSGSSPADEVAEMKAKYTAEQIAQGQALYQANCNKCHEYPKPEEHTVAKWDRVLPRMSKKSNLTADQAGLVRAWVITNCKL